MLRIGYDAKRLFHNFTGLGNYSRTLVRLMYGQYPANSYHLFTPSLRVHPETRFFYKKENIHLHTAGKRLKPIWRSRGILKDLKGENIQLYHGLSHEIPFGIRRSGIRSVVTIHDLVFKVYPEYFPFIDRQIYDYKFRYACENADQIIAISESTRDDILKYYDISAEKISVIYQTCHERFMLAPDPERQDAVRKKYKLPEKFLLYVGSITARKKLLAIIQALELLAEDLRLPLVVVGDGGAYLKKIKTHLARSPVRDFVIFTKNVAMADLPYFYQAAEIFIYPSEYEGFGIPNLEALFSGTPVITSASSSLPEAAGPDSYFASAQAPETIAAGIEAILTNEQFRKKMVVNGRNYAENFKPETVTATMMELYKSLI